MPNSCMPPGKTRSVVETHHLGFYPFKIEMGAGEGDGSGWEHERVYTI